jgi:DNA ligase-1
LRKHLQTSPRSSASDDIPSTLSDLFDALSSRRVTGNEAKDLVVAFLRRHGVLGSELLSDGSPRAKGATVDLELIGVFERLLDRNLVAGFGARTLHDVPWLRSVGVKGGSSNPPNSKPAYSTSVPPTAPARSLEIFQCALGKTIDPPFSDLSKHPRWFASRKLDGVRALTLLDFLVPSDGTSPRLVSVQLVSRTGKEFTSLSNLRSQLRHTDAFPRLREWLERDPEEVRTQHDGVVKRLVLDGEVCVMRPRSAEEMRRVAKRHDDGIGAAALWVEEDGLVEDFPATTSEIRRMNHTIEHPAYFLFDVLSWGEVSAKGALPPPLGRTFGERIADLKQLTQWLDADLERQHVKERFTRMLVQWEVKGEQQEGVQGMVHRAADEGWEGLIFRADKPYKGTRS